MDDDIMDRVRELEKSLGDAPNNPPSANVEGAGVLDGELYCITGITDIGREAFGDLIRRNGGRPCTTCTLASTVLITNVETRTRKRIMAERAGSRIMTEQAFMRMLNQRLFDAGYPRADEEWDDSF